MKPSMTGDIHIRTYNLCIVGLGHVGSALVALLQRKRQELADRYGICLARDWCGLAPPGLAGCPRWLHPGEVVGR